MIPQAAHSRGLFPFDSILFAFLAGGGPTIAAVLLLLAMKGRYGPGELVARVVRWRVPALWYLVAIFGGGVILATAFGLARTIAGEPFADLIRIIPRAALPGLLLFGGINVLWEEIGWRGFALPRLQDRHGARVASLIVGLLWGLWRLPLF